jgi:putative transposase
MARLARVVVPGLPHHVTQRGNGRQQTFFGAPDFARYRDLLGRECRAADVEVWAWCLMPNHVHLILVPHDPDGLRRALSKVHRHYAGAIHLRENRSGHFWQGRFGAVAMDEAHLAAAVRYVLLNPVRAGLAARPRDWPWSSIHAHLGGTGDGVTAIGPIEDRFPGLAGLLDAGADDREAHDRLRRAESVGRPLGSAAFVAALADRLGRPLAPGKRGRRARGADPKSN